jgi:HEPN domain-containing protein
MNREALIVYWRESALKDCETMHHLFASQDYHWALFIGHLVIEKLLKAVYVKNIDINPPKTHDLSRLAERCNLIYDEEMADILDRITAFNISARYPDYEMSFYEKCTPEFTEKNILMIEEVKKWLMPQI